MRLVIVWVVKVFDQRYEYPGTPPDGIAVAVPSAVPQWAIVVVVLAVSWLAVDMVIVWLEVQPCASWMVKVYVPAG